MHELAHLLEANHGPRFWKLVSAYPLGERARGYLMALDMEADDLDGEEGPEGAEGTRARQDLPDGQDGWRGRAGPAATPCSTVINQGSRDRAISGAFCVRPAAGFSPPSFRTPPGG